MPAFLSHSSKDKAFVTAVAAELRPLDYELDESTFEYTLNVRAIRNAISRSDLAVFFVSSNSISSSFVQEEQRQILEAIGRGSIKKVIVFSIDGTSYKALPDWLREINIVQQIGNPKLCARRIEALLIELDLSEEPEFLYLGRDEDEKALRRPLSAPGAETPVALHMVGFHGIGRRTFVRNTLRKLFPRFYNTFITETASSNQSVDDLYRALYRATSVSSVHERVADFQNFQVMAFEDKCQTIADLIHGMAESGEMLIVFDEGGGVFDDAGEFFPHWSVIINALSLVRRPIITFIQTRMQPYKFRNKNVYSFHQKIDAIKLEDAKEIISFSLKQREIDFTDKQLTEVAQLAGGHPFNIRFAVGLADHYSLEVFLKDPGVYISWRDKRGEEFISEIKFDEVEEEIMACLIDYKYLATEAVLSLVSRPLDVTLEALRNLQDFCCVEFRDGMFHLASPIRESVRRDQRFERDDNWHRAAASRIIAAVEAYEPEDQVALNLIETATMAAVRGDGAPAYIRSMVLPSHLLIVAREHYDAGRERRRQCIALCKEALSFTASMTDDAKVEALRLWALSSARLKDAAEFEHATSQLVEIRKPIATRILEFARGFKSRLESRDDDAETHFKKAWGLSKTNASVNRELAKLYSGQRRYAEAEKYARQAYSTSPTNPYVLDIMLEVLLGQKSQQISVDENELRDVTDALREYGNAPGLSFFPVREAQRFLDARNYTSAINSADAAIHMTPKLVAPYFIKFHAQLRQGGSLNNAETTLKELEGLLKGAEGSDGEETRLAEAGILLQIERGHHEVAKEAIDNDRRLPRTIRKRLLDTLAKEIAFQPQRTPQKLIDWAKRHR